MAACTARPPASRAAAPSRSSHAALSGGTFVRVEGDGYDQISVLRPGATGWTLVGDTPKPPVANGRYWTLAPDGLLVAVIVDGTSLVVADVDGGPPRTVATAPTGSTICAPDWSADSARLTYVERHPRGDGTDAGTTYQIAPDGTGRVVVQGANADGECDRTVAMAGGTTAFPGRKGTLVVMTGAKQRSMMLGGKNFIHDVLAVSRDATKAVVTAQIGVEQVFLFDLRTGDAVPLPEVRPAGPALFDGDGHVLAIVAGDPVVRTFDTAGRPIATSPVITTRPATVSLLTWSP